MTTTATPSKKVRSKPTRKAITLSQLTAKKNNPPVATPVVMPKKKRAKPTRRTLSITEIMAGKTQADVEKPKRDPFRAALDKRANEITKRVNATNAIVKALGGTTTLWGWGNACDFGGGEHGYTISVAGVGKVLLVQQGDEFRLRFNFDDHFKKQVEKAGFKIKTRKPRVPKYLRHLQESMYVARVKP